MNAVAGYASYSWSNGDATQSTVISTPGFYNVTVTDANGCTGISPSVEVVINPDELELYQLQEILFSVMEEVLRLLLHLPLHIHGLQEKPHSPSLFQQQELSPFQSRDCALHLLQDLRL